jgi:hypothetical protein
MDGIVFPVIQIPTCELMPAFLIRIRIQVVNALEFQPRSEDYPEVTIATGHSPLLHFFISVLVDLNVCVELRSRDITESIMYSAMWCHALGRSNVHSKATLLCIYGFQNLYLLRSMSMEETKRYDLSMHLPKKRKLVELYL